jgi:hypothetical protein
MHTASVSRGRTFVLMTGVAAIGICGLIISTSLPA